MRSSMEKFKLNLHVCDEIEKTLSFDTELERKAYSRGFMAAAELVSVNNVFVVNYEHEKKPNEIHTPTEVH